MQSNESILDVDYRTDGDVLYRHHSKPSRVVERIVPWGPEAAAWRIATREWQPFVPEFDVSYLEETACHPGASRLPSWRRRVTAYRFLIERWPQEARDVVRGFPSAHWQLLQFVNTGDTPALELLRSNPALGYLAAMAGAANQIGLRRRNLAALFGFPETEHAVRLLRKVPTAWVSGEFLAQLRAAMTQGRDAEAIITHLVHINPIALEVARDPELRASIAPDCITRLSRVPASVAHCDLIARVRDVLESARNKGLPTPRIRRFSDLDRSVYAAPRRAHPGPRRHTPRVESFAFPAPPPHDLAIPGSLPPPPLGTVPDLNPPVSAAQVQAPSSRRSTRKNPFAFPEPPLADLAAAGIRIHAIRGRHDLVAESDAMNHCAGRDKSYARRVAGGRLYFYRMIEPERLTIAIRPRGDWWAVEEIRGICNRQPSEFASLLIWDWVRQSSEPSVEGTCSESTPPARPAAAVLRQTQLRPRRGTPENQLSFDFSVSL